MANPTTQCHKVEAKIYSGGEGTSHYYCPVCDQSVNFDGSNPEMTEHSDSIREKINTLIPQTHCPSSCDGNGTYAEADKDGDPTPAQCQYCYEVRLPLIDKLEDLFKAYVKQVLPEKDKLMDGVEPIATAVRLDDFYKGWNAHYDQTIRNMEQS